MNSQLQIEFRNTAPIEAVESRIRQELAELEKFYNRLAGCRVEIEAPAHERRGGLSKVLVDLELPTEDAKAWAEWREISPKDGKHNLQIKAKHRDASMAVHAAFNLARQQLRDFVAVPHHKEA
jgi:ribosome-associated translation inhibitor RaiA